MQVYRGRLYWGTMHVPLSALLAKWNVYGAPSDESDAFVDVLGTWRATSIFSLTGRGQAQLEFGQRYFAVWNPSSEGIYLNWNIVPGAMGAPKIGLSGFGNPFNNYSWSMAVARDQLFVGTMDWSYLANGIVSAPATGVAISPSQAGVSAPDWQFGADLWALGGGRQLTATAIYVSGLDTELNYGIRTMALMGGRLYMGTANPMNLNPAGGFRLDSLRFVKVIYR
jgi:hypothetical protein